MSHWDLRRALIDWDLGADGLWFDNRAYARDQKLLPDGSITGPPQEEISAAAGELDRVSDSTHRALTSWNRLGEQLLGPRPPADAEEQLPMFYDEKKRLAQVVANELGRGWTVTWRDSDGVEHACATEVGD